IGVSVLATSTGFNWRIAFWIGAAVAIIGSVARTTLRESVEYADGIKRIQRFAMKFNTPIGDIQVNVKVKTKNALAYFGVMCVSPIIIYFVYFYSTGILKNLFHYTANQILMHNLLVGIIAELLGYAVLRTYLT